MRPRPSSVKPRHLETRTPPVFLTAFPHKALMAPPVGSDRVDAESQQILRRVESRMSAGIAQLVEHQLPKLRVAGSSPVPRFETMSGIAAEPQEETLMKGAQKPKKGDKKPAQKTLKEKRQDKRNAAKGNTGLQ
jgi:hypothetical protein